MNFQTILNFILIKFMVLSLLLYSIKTVTNVTFLIFYFKLKIIIYWPLMKANKL